MNGLVAFFVFEVRRLLRSRRYLFFTFGFPLLFYALFLKSAPEGGATPIAGTVWRNYYMVSMASFGAMVAAFNAGGARLAGERASGWVRRLRVTPLPSWAYVVTKLATGIALALPVILLVEVLGAVDGQVRLTAGTWLSITVLTWVGTLPFAGLGVLIGFLATSDTAYPLTNALMFLLAYFGGLFQPVTILPAVLRNIAHAMPSYNLASLGWRVLADRGLGPVHPLILLAYLVAFGLLIVWRYQGEQAQLVV